MGLEHGFLRWFLVSTAICGRPQNSDLLMSPGFPDRTV